MNFWKKLFRSKGSQKDMNPNEISAYSSIDSNPFMNANHVLVDRNMEEKVKDEDQRNVLCEPTEDADFYIKNGMMHLGQGINNHDANEYSKALKWFKTALTIEPQSSDAYNNIGMVYAQQNEVKLALDNFQKAIELNPKSSAPYHNLSTLYTSMGNQYDAAGQYDLAIDHFQKAIDSHQENAAAYYGMAYAYSKKGDGKTPVKYMIKAATLGHKAAQDFCKHFGLTWKSLTKIDDVKMTQVVNEIK
jgi:tetratricopeptide (TPR) repeat protein